MTDKTVRTQTASFEARVGDKVIIELQGVGGRFSTEFAGWEKRRYILIKLPAKLDLMDHIYPEKPAIARYLRQGGEVHAFRTTVQAVIHSPYRLVFLDYPQIVETVQLRKMPRADCFFPASFEIGGVSAKGYLVNISQGGARASIEKDRYGLAQAIVPGAAVSCGFAVLTETAAQAKAEGVIKKVIEEKDQRLFSMEFTSIDAASKERIQAYINELEAYVLRSNACQG